MIKLISALKFKAKRKFALQEILCGALIVKLNNYTTGHSGKVITNDIFSLPFNEGATDTGLIVGPIIHQSS